MPRRKLGYVELEWTCPTCKQRNPGSQKVCKACGAAQPESAQFEVPVEQKLVTEPATVARAQVGPDTHCPFCNARNRADATICSQCGAELTQAVARKSGEVVGAFDEKPKPPIPCPACANPNPANATLCSKCGSPLRKPVAIPTMPQKEQRGWIFGLVFILFGLALLAVFAGLIYMGTRTETIVGTVQSAEWVRRVEIEALVPVGDKDWYDQIPDDATIGRCELEMRGRSDTPQANSKEVCGTPYTVDQGTGFGEVMQECWYELYDDMCSYTVKRWRTVDTITTRGADFSPFWPQLDLNFEQRVGDRSETFRCAMAGNGTQYNFEPSSFEEFSRCEVGQRWQMEVNGFGSISGLQPLD